jgi:drug/metabolite transporter (DMT)-like permease
MDSPTSPPNLPRSAIAPPPYRLALASLLAIQLLMGVWPVVGKWVMQSVSVRVLVGVRILVAGPLLWLLARPWRQRLTIKEIAWCGLLGMLGVVGNQTLFSEGLLRASPLNSAVIGCSIPAWTLLFAVVLGHERPTPLRVGGVALALSGALLLVGVDRLDLGPERALGNLMLIGNSALYAAYLVLSRPILTRHGALPVIGWVFGLATPLILPYAWADLAALQWTAVPDTTLAGLAYIVIGPTLLGYALSAYALRAVTASTAAVFVYVQPFITGLVSGRVLGERPSWQTAAAAALIFAGVALVSRRPAADRLAAQEP